MLNKLSTITLCAFLLIVVSTSAQAQWHFSADKNFYVISLGDSFTVEVKMSGSGADLDAFGFDFSYPSELIQYDSPDFTGTLIEGWGFKDVNEYAPGTLKVAGFNFTDKIVAPAKGTWVKLNFIVKPDTSGQGQFIIGAFGDDLLTDGSTSTPAWFVTKIEPTWAVPIHIVSDSLSLTRTFGGGDDQATNGYDAGLDIPCNPPDSVYFAYFEIDEFPNYLGTDIRSFVPPYDVKIEWVLTIVNTMGDLSTLTWESSDIPPEGVFTLSDGNDAIDMRADTTFSFEGDRELRIKYQGVMPEITVTAPNGGDTLRTDSMYDIKWVSDNFMDAVKIELSVDGGVSWLSPAIAESTDNDGVFTWDVTDNTSTSCLIRISDAVDGDPTDTSDDVFTIAWPTQVVTNKDMHGPKRFRLLQNYPNPFNPETHIAFDIPEKSNVELAVYDLQGRKIRTLIQGDRAAGHHLVVWNSQDSKGLKVPSGVYIYRMKAGSHVFSNKMILLK